ncbi:MAG: hypothetical protein J5629_05530, partial [Muribaculaceae bacterium]|nr:hypothetical protein [Muribaculaceae bacterium]
RPYKAKSDEITSHFLQKDWLQILPNVNENILIDMSEAENVVILSAFDKDMCQLFGVIVLMEQNNRISFHGGVCKHDSYHTLLAYEGLNEILHILVDNGFDVYVTCNETNVQADRLQRRFGFVEYEAKQGVSYKHLDVERFLNCDISQHLTRCMAQKTRIKENI